MLLSWIGFVACSVVEAVREQVGKGIHLQQNCTISRPTVELLEKLDANTPPELSRFFFNCELGKECSLSQWPAVIN